MPIYEYKCKSCGLTFEKLVKVNSKETINCPECSGDTKKLISSAGLVFKGSGFYITDYSKKGKAPKETSKSTASKSDPKKTVKKDKKINA